MGNWIDYKQLRERLAFETVFVHYKLEPKLKGKQHHGFCPLPTHQGNRNSPSFSANFDKGIFQCFGCSAKGNILEFCVRMESANPENKEEFRMAAEKIQIAFGLKASGRKVEKPEQATSKIKANAPQAITRLSVNAPLDFELKGLNPEHPYLAKRKFTPETIQDFGLGFCSRGYLKDRIAIPLHDNSGELIGYAGRVIDDAVISETNPKYLLPGERTREGVTYRFQKSEFLYSGFRIKEAVRNLIVVEGFASVWWLYQNGFADAVALMGSSCSENQAKLIIQKTETSGTVWIFADGNEAGQRCAQLLFELIAPLRNVRFLKLENEKQPTDVLKHELRLMLDQSQMGSRSASAQSVRKIATRKDLADLANRFPCLHSFSLTETNWDLETEILERLAWQVPAASQSAIRFILHVADPNRQWKCGGFNAMEALKHWNDHERSAFLEWGSSPWWGNQF